MRTKFAYGLVAGIVTALLGGCGKEAGPAMEAKLPAVSVFTVAPRDVPISYEFVAQTQSSHQVDINARVSGYLEKRLYKEGELVKAGQVLFQMDAKPFQVQLDQAKAVLQRQQARLQTAKANLDRTRPLAQQNALSQRDLDDAVGQFQSANADAEQAKAQVEGTKLDLSYTRIVSPVTGYASASVLSEGTYVSPQNSLLTTVSVVSPIWVNFSLSENQLQRFRNQVAQKKLTAPANESYDVEVLLVDGSVFPHHGRITFSNPSYDSQTGTFLIRAEVANPDGVLRPNQFVRVRLKGAIRPQALLVPQRAVHQGATAQFVWVVDAQNKVQNRPVATGEWIGDDWYISDGLKPGERVVVDGGQMLTAGEAVQPAPLKAAAPVQPATGG